MAMKDGVAAWFSNLQDAIKYVKQRPNKNLKISKKQYWTASGKKYLVYFND
jgi:hypothetical protein